MGAGGQHLHSPQGGGVMVSKLCSPNQVIFWGGDVAHTVSALLLVRSVNVTAATHSMPAARSSRRFCSAASRRASSSCFSRALRFAFFPCVFANLQQGLHIHIEEPKFIFGELCQNLSRKVYRHKLPNEFTFTLLLFFFLT